MFDVLRNHTVADTNDIDVLRTALVETYDVKSVIGLGDTSSFHAKASNFNLGTCSLSYCLYGSGLEVEFRDDSFHRIQFAMSGAGWASSSDMPLMLDPSVIVSSPGHTTCTFDGPFRQIVLRADKARLEKDIAILTGVSPKNRVRFAPTVSVTASHANLLRATIMNSVAIIDASHENIPGPLLQELEQTVRMATLFGIPHNYSDFITSASSAEPSSRVRRIEEWIDANWRESITIEKLAEISGISARSIFAAFKKERGYSPMAYAKTARLNAARNLLQAPNNEATVTGIGYYCNFMNMSRFAEDYRRQFGELPSQTLRRARH